MSNKKTPRKKLTPEQRLTRYAERYLRMRAAGKSKYARSGALLIKMISAGLMPGKPIEVAGHGKFVLVDNFEGERTGGWATVPHYELKPLSKKKSESAAAAALAAEVVP